MSGRSAAAGGSAAGGLAVGVVSEFDAGVGLGTVIGSDGSWRFHCTQIADGSRDIAAGTPVTFVLVPRRHGVWEAYAVAPRAAAG